MSERTASEQGPELVVTFDHVASCRIIDAVIDVDEFGGPIGIEIIGILNKYPNLTIKTNGHLPAVSVDRENDVVYIKVAEGRAIDQIVRAAAVAVSSSQTLQQVHVEMEHG